VSAKILVIDDENNIRMMIRLALQHVGHTVETAADGSEGLEKFGDGTPWDVVLLDQRMPGLEGMEVLRAMRLRQPAARIIMITAYGTIDLAVEAMKAGATDFLRKPFTADTLRNAVRAALDGEYVERVKEGEEPSFSIFGRRTFNGFYLEFLQAPGQQIDGDLRHVFTVISPSRNKCECTVSLPAYVVELVKAHADREEMPGGYRFWQSLCEEALANYLWQYAEIPMNGFLRVEEFTTDLRHWVDAMLRAAE
jgi:DNA-binding response OmpR family regulator